VNEEAAMLRDRVLISAGGGLAALVAGFWAWQTPGRLRGPLRPPEIDRALRAIAAQLPLPADAPPGAHAETLARLRAWAAADDGRPVYMLNLMRVRDQLRAIHGTPAFEGTPQEANAHYEQAVWPLLLKRGGYPLVGGPTQAGSLVPAAPDDVAWSRILVVRYPSRRAFLELLADPTYAPLEPYKLMAMELALVPVSGDVVIPELRTVVGLAALAAFLGLGWRRATGRARQRGSAG
jgi:hypothetical protein